MSRFDYYLATELKVDHDDGDLGARNNKDEEHNEEETKQVVELVLPNCLQIKQKQITQTQIDEINEPKIN